MAPARPFRRRLRETRGCGGRAWPECEDDGPRLRCRAGVDSRERPPPYDSSNARRGLISVLIKVTGLVNSQLRRATTRVPPVDQIAERNPFECANKRGEAPFTSLKVDAVAKPICGLDPSHAGLPRIDFPRVDVKDLRHPRPQDPAHAPEPRQIGNKPEVAAPAPRDPALAEPDARDTDFIETIAEQNDRRTRIHPFKPAIAIMR